ncbi:MAG: TAXI family TRAP transporter solute-binding subunit [Treponema sp.]|nr:TAXI family TRAP transporter solute-binding subunit [Treponema sp.]
MAHYTDWLPTTRDGQLAMAKDWHSVAGTAAAWGIPAAVLTDLGTRIQTAEAALTTAKNETTRTPVATAQCRAAFDEMIAAMRDMKRRYFLTPPLMEADYIALGLKPHDATPTPIGPPAAQVTVETFLVGRHELGAKIIYVTGSAADPANKGYRIWYTVIPPGETPPADPDDLRKSFFTKRKKDVIEFDFGDSGKTAYFAVQIENDGKKGPWGPLVSALIP